MNISRLSINEKITIVIMKKKKKKRQKGRKHCITVYDFIIPVCQL